MLADSTDRRRDTRRGLTPSSSSSGDAVRAHLSELAGEVDRAVGLYLCAARRTTSTAERDHLTKRAARLRS